ncbi:DUF5819 family protein [Myroides sp. WP-1]|uniref:DUF5819 family protein n=1 Tax=Myroides sp. WP-1 TaxID=2759944 RepID=UPI0015FE2A9C|nr:DUF5819 family protein [Myroides sp. WP-1]MBB1138995.1 hypothetical protein [Myroides sp. WP-1]
MKKIFKLFSILIVIVYFLFIGSVQLYDLNYFESKPLNQLKENYALPFFEQNWSMFSPNPPSGNHFFLLKFSTQKQTSGYIDIQQKIRERSFSRCFSIDQRLKKYFSGCFNDIIEIQNAGVDLSLHAYKSQGLESLLNYSKFVFENQTDFKGKLQPKDSVFVNIYLVDEQLNKDIHQKKSYTTLYSELDKIYLLKKE